jgi:hypothetical protein
MSSTNNVQNLLVNLLRPSYRYDATTGEFTPSLSLSNVSELIAGRIQTDALTVTDNNINTFLGSNAGLLVSNSARNVGIGYNAMSGAVNASSNVAIGFNSLDGVSNASCNVALGAGTDISDGGTRSVLIGPNVTLGGGSNNILIGANLSRGSVNNQLQIGTLLYGDLSFGYIGVNTSAPRAAFDVSGVTVFNNKVGFQVPDPKYSLDVAGTVYASERFFGSNGSAKAPLYSFKDISGTGMYVPPTTEPYPAGSFGISANGEPIAIFSQNRVQFLRDLDVSGLFSSGTVAFATFAVTNGSIATPAMTFTSDLSTGVYRPAAGQQLGLVAGAREAIRIYATGDVSLQRLLVQDISSSGAFVSSAVSASNQIGGVTFSNTDLSMSGLLLAPVLRNARIPTQFDISGGNLSNSGVHIAGTFLGTASTSNQIGGVTFSATDLSMSGGGRILGSASSSNSIGGVTLSGGNLVMASGGQMFGSATTSNQIGGVTLSANDLCMAGVGRILGSATAGNWIGGITLAGSDLSMSSTGRILAPIVRNALIPTQYDISGGNLWLSTTLQAGSVLTTATTSNQIGGVTLSANDLCMAGVGRIVGSATASNWIGGITLAGSDLSMSSTGLLLAPTLRNARIATQFDISQGNLRVASNVQGGSGTMALPTYAFTSDPSTGVFLSAASTLGLTTAGVRRVAVLPSGDISMGRILVSDVSASGAIFSSFGSNNIGGVTLCNGLISTGGTISTTNLVVPGYLRDALTAPTLDISLGNISNSATTTSLRFRGSAGSVAVPTFSFVSDPSTGLHLGAGGSYLGFDTAGTQRMCLSGGLVGIATSAPMSLLDLSDGTLSIRRRIAVPDNRASLEVGGGYDSTLATGVPAVAFQSNAGGFRHFIRSRHAAATGTTANALDFFLNTGTTNTASIAPGTSNTVGLSVTAQGVGVATVNPAYALDVSGAEANIQSAAGTGTLYLGGQTAGVYLQRDLVGNGFLRPLASDVSLYLGAKDSNTLVVGTTGVVVRSGATNAISLLSTGTVQATTVQATTLQTAPIVRNALIPTQFDISQGNISNSGTHLAATFLGTAATSSNQIGGVTFSNMDLCMSAPGLLVAPVVRNARIPTQFDISGGTISNSGTHLAATFLGTAATSSNQIGGVTFSNMDLCMSAPGLLVAPLIRNARIPTQFDISGGNLSNAGTTRSTNFLAVPGGASRPGYAFTSDLSTGMDLGGTSYLAFETGGVQRMCISGGLVGIATPAPMSLLDLSDGTLGIRRRARNSDNTASIELGGGYTNLGAGGTPALAFQFQDGGYRHFIRSRHTPGSGSNNSLDFFINSGVGDASSTAPGVFNSNVMSVTGNGVGIGRNPTSSIFLDVSGPMQIQRFIGVNDNLNLLRFADASGLSAIDTAPVRIGLGLREAAGPGNTGGDFVINTYDNSGLAIGLPALLLQRGTGRLGIGTAGPSSILEVYDTSATIRVSSANRNAGVELNRSGAPFGTSTFVDWRLQTIPDGGAFQIVRGSNAGNVVGLHIEGSSGNRIGLGQFNPVSTLDISGTVRIGAGLGTGETTTNTAQIELGGGVNTLGIGGLPAIAFHGRDDSGNVGYRHFIRSRHSGGTNTNCNAIQFFLNNSNTTGGSTAPGTGNRLGMSITNMGRLGVATDAPAYGLDVSGSARISGGLIFSVQSI